MAILLVEQNVPLTLEISRRVYIMEKGWSATTPWLPSCVSMTLSCASIWECSVVLEQLLQAIPFDQLLIQTINGIVTGMILALVASGLTLIFGIMDVVNFAHGELFMLGAYVGVVTLAATGDFWIALVVATFIVALLGAAIHVTVLRPLLGRHPLTTILATFGISWCCRIMRSGSSARWRARSRSPATSRSSIWTIRGTGS